MQRSAMDQGVTLWQLRKQQEAQPVGIRRL